MKDFLIVIKDYYIIIVILLTFCPYFFYIQKVKKMDVKKEISIFKIEPIIWLCSLEAFFLYMLISSIIYLTFKTLPINNSEKELAKLLPILSSILIYIYTFIPLAFYVIVFITVHFLKRRYEITINDIFIEARFNRSIRIVNNEIVMAKKKTGYYLIRDQKGKELKLNIMFLIIFCNYSTLIYNLDKICNSPSLSADTFEKG